MDIPPRRVGKRLIGRFLLLRILLGTVVLTATTVGGVFWSLYWFSDAINPSTGQPYGLDYYSSGALRSTALNILSFGAVGITVSARFSRKSSFHLRSFRGNPVAFYAYAILILLQIGITYIPGLNSAVFWMEAMDGQQWLIVVVMFFVVLFVMEFEKAIRNFLSSLKYDVDDREEGVFDSFVEPDTTPLPAESRRFGMNELNH